MAQSVPKEKVNIREDYASGSRRKEVWALKEVRTKTT